MLIGEPSATGDGGVAGAWSGRVDAGLVDGAGEVWGSCPEADSAMPETNRNVPAALASVRAKEAENGWYKSIKVFSNVGKPRGLDGTRARSVLRIGRTSATTIMPKRKPAVVAILLSAAWAGSTLTANRPSGPPSSVGRRAAADIKDDRFALTVDSIMRGPDLVGYAPEGLRWSADSQKLYFRVA
jgi:hypothetical protein